MRKPVVLTYMLLMFVFMPFMAILLTGAPEMPAAGAGMITHTIELLYLNPVDYRPAEFDSNHTVLFENDPPTPDFIPEPSPEPLLESVPEHSESAVPPMTEPPENPESEQPEPTVPELTELTVTELTELTVTELTLPEPPLPHIPDKIAYLTFDDGPSRDVTPGILDVLADEGIVATFFVLTHMNVDDIYWRIINEGHELGNHSSSHNYSLMYGSNINLFYEDVMQTQNFLMERFAYRAELFRFPGGSMGRNLGMINQRKALLEEMGLRYFDWHIDSRDAHPRQTDRSAAAIIHNVLNNTRGRDRVIILMHDTGSRQTTLEALPNIIAGLRNRGYEFDLLSNYQMLEQ